MGIHIESNIGRTRADISGQVVYLASGFNEVLAQVNISGVTSSISGQRVWIADFSGNSIETVAIGGERYVRALISGQPVTANVNVAANVSGNIVYLTSGFNNVQVTNTPTVITNISGNGVNISAFDPSGAVWRELWVDQSGGRRLLVSTSGQTARISGQTVISEISGQTIVIGSQPISVTTSISGQVVNVGTPAVTTSVSGNAVGISGQTIVAQNSGQIAYLTSGQNSVQVSGQTISVGNTVTIQGTVTANTSGQMSRIQGFDPSGNTWRDLWVNQSGGNVLKVDATVQTQTNISGQIVYLTSGQNSAQISGETLRMQMFDPSGATWRNVISEQSGGGGLRVSIAQGASVTEVGLASYSRPTSNLGLFVLDTLYGYDDTAGNFKRINVSQSGSTDPVHRLLVGISGQPVTLVGQSIIANVYADDSGAGSAVEIVTHRSGGEGLLVGPETPSRLQAYPILYASAASGGTALDSGISQRVTLRNISQTSGAVVFVGFSGTNNSPFLQTSTSGRGFYLRDGDGVTIGTTNPAFIRVVAGTSGIPISYKSEAWV